MRSLELFNAVEHKDNNHSIFISEDGYIIEKGAMWAKNDIINYLNSNTLNGDGLNKTFHKSWSKIKNSSRTELYIDQIRHYLSTYGSNFSDEVYIPEEVLDISGVTLKYKVIKSYTKKELISKGLNILSSSIALTQDTINLVLDFLTEDMGYVFDGSENIKNKEAVIIIADKFNIYPSDPVEFLRYIIYKSTNNTLLIKNDETIEAIKKSDFNPEIHLKNYGYEKLAEIFNRFKPLFLAYKNKCSRDINKISKLSKKLHKPIVSNPLNLATQRILSDKDIKWLDNASVFSIFKTLSACYNRGYLNQDTFLFKIRNGKSWHAKKDTNVSLCKKNTKFIEDYLKNRINLSNERIYIPKGVQYSLPTSEKMFVGNVPVGTKITGNKLAVGVYWENSGGAYDLDLSGNNIDGKVGWNSSYNQDNGRLMYSGDITNAPNGAVEYLYANKGLNNKTIVNLNVYSGSLNSKYKIILGKGDDINVDYMMNPSNVFFQADTQSVQKNNTIGLLLPEVSGEQSFVVLNFGSGNRHVSNLSNEELEALVQEWSTPYTLDMLFNKLDIKITNKDDCTIDLSLDNLEKDSLINIFS
jgi:hypothetical protein